MGIVFVHGGMGVEMGKKVLFVIFLSLGISFWGNLSGDGWIARASAPSHPPGGHKGSGERTAAHSENKTGPESHHESVSPSETHVEGGNAHGESHHASPPDIYIAIWVVLAALVNMILLYYAVKFNRKRKDLLVTGNIRDMSKLMSGVGAHDEVGQFRYRDADYYVWKKPKHLIHLPQGILHEHHLGDDNYHRRLGELSDDEAIWHEEQMLAKVEGKDFSERHGNHVDSGNHVGDASQEGVNSKIFASFLVVLTLAVFLLSYIPPVFMHFDKAALAFVDGYHEPVGWGVLSSFIRLSLAISMMVYGLSSMGEQH